MDMRERRWRSSAYAEPVRNRRPVAGSLSDTRSSKSQPRRVVGTRPYRATRPICSDLGRRTKTGRSPALPPRSARNLPGSPAMEWPHSARLGGAVHDEAPGVIRIAELDLHRLLLGA